MNLPVVLLPGKIFRHLLLMAAIVMIGNWQFTFLRYTLKWDALDLSFPWRYFLGHSLQNGEMPYWLAYHTLGHPFYIDAQSWYPLSWLIGACCGYDFYSFHLEFLAHLIIAAWGMYWLARVNRISPAIAIVAGITYSFSGFMVGNAQHYAAIVSAAWIPFVLASTIQLARVPNLKQALLIAVFSYLLLSGGYPQFIYSTAIIAIAILLYAIVKYARAKKPGHLKKIISFGFLSLALFILLSSFMIVSFHEASFFMLRGTALPFEKLLASGGAFTFKSFLSFIFPYATVVEPASWGTDVAFNNAYFGIGLLPFMALAFVKKPSGVNIGWLICGLFFMILSVGGATPFFKLFYHSFPLSGHFRMFAFYRLFFIIPFIILACDGLQSLAKDNNKLPSIIIFFLISTVVFVAVFMALKYEIVGFSLLKVIENTLLEGVSFVYEHVLVQAPFQILFLGSLFFLIRNPRGKMIYIIGIIIIDVFLAYQLNAPFTQYHKSGIETASALQKKIRQLPRDYPPPVMQPINEHPPYPDLAPLWQNRGIYVKQVVLYGYNPYILNSYYHFDTSRYKNEVVQMPVVFMTDTIIMHHSKNKWKAHAEPLSISRGEGREFNIEEFTPSRVRIKVNNEKPVVLTLLQNNYPGWKASVNGKEAVIYPAFYSFMSVTLEEGPNEVLFVHKPWQVKFGFPISLTMFSVLTIALGILLIKDRRE